MPRFIFKLEAVLTQRKHQEQHQQRELALRQAVLTYLQTALRRVNDQVQSSNSEMRNNRLTGSLDMNFLAAHRRFLAAMQRRAITIVQKMGLAQRQVDEASTLLAEAAKRRKAIEKLREKQQARWRAELRRKEQIELDEIGTQIAYRNLIETGPVK